LARLLDQEPGVARALDDVVRELNADPDALDALLERRTTGLRSGAQRTAIYPTALLRHRHADRLRIED